MCAVCTWCRIHATSDFDFRAGLGISFPTDNSLTLYISFSHQHDIELFLIVEPIHLEMDGFADEFLKIEQTG